MVSTNISANDWLFGNGKRLRTQREPQADWFPNTDEEVASALQTERTRFLWIASTATAASWLGSHLLFPPLHLVSIPLTLAAALPLFQKAIVSVRSQRPDISQVGSLGVIGGLLIQQTTCAALIPLLYFAGQTSVAKWQKAIQTADETAIDASLLADSDIQIVRCWQEKSDNAPPVMRFVLESLDDPTRQGFTQVSDLLESLREKATASQTDPTPTVISDE